VNERPGKEPDDLPPTFDGELFHRFESLLAEILDQDPGHRERALQAICAKHPEHASYLRGMYRNVLNMEVLLQPNLSPGTKMGDYQIRGVLGEGGMGVVYLADQEQPIRRQVALKVIQPGRDSKRVLARFELERQALAVMNHAAIAKVFDAGVTDSGQPYFAMEFVDGHRLTDYCDQFALTLVDRLRLFQQVCHGVHHAHQKGILHRDLKPGNILVAQKTGGHDVKIIDFGLARASDPQASRSFVTENGVLVGTPEYMSPEQARNATGSIDTRTDIYSLGVVLYELLTGDLPFRSEDLRRQSASEIQRILCEDTPPTPSSRVAKLIPKTHTGIERDLSHSALHRHACDGQGTRAPIFVRCRARPRPAALPRPGSGRRAAAELVVPDVQAGAPPPGPVRRRDRDPDRADRRDSRELEAPPGCRTGPRYDTPRIQGYERRDVRRAPSL
jgi:serine/threonine protein kinase